jgi:protein involved in polysaccharide export with SLBB domain
LFLGGAGFYIVWSHTRTVATMQLIRRDPPTILHVGDPNDAFKPHQFSDAALTAMIRSPDLLRKVGERSGMPATALTASLGAIPDENSELVNLVYSGPLSPPNAVKLLGLYSDEIIKETQDLQVREGQETSRFLAGKVDNVNQSIEELRQKIAAIPPEQKVVDNDQSVAACLLQLQDLDVKCDLARIELESANPVAERLQAARDQLVALQARYTDAHPAVQDQKQTIHALEQELAGQSKAPLTDKAGIVSPLVTRQNQALARQLEEFETLRDRVKARLATLSNTNLSYALLKNRMDVLQLTRTTLASRQHEADVYASDAGGYYRVFRPAELADASRKTNWRKAIIGAVGGGFVGAALMAAFLMGVEIVDPRLKTVGDVERATGLPVLATLGDLSEMTEEDKRAWAFRTWTIIKGKITASQRHSLVCGVISARPGEGRSTWVNLLAKTAFDRGMRVVVAEPRASEEPPVHPHEQVFPQLEQGIEIPPPAPNAIAIPVKTTSTTALAQNGFKFPIDAARQLGAGEGPSLVHIPLPGWAWNMDCRNEWRDGLAEWEKIENMIFLVELPAVTRPEAVLLAENLPQLIWLSKSGEVGAVETKKHLETLRHAGCNLVGAVVNGEKSWLRKRFGRWLAMAALLLAVAGGAQAQDVNTNVSAGGTNTATNAVYWPQPMQRAPWQQHLVLGPGDVLTFQFYGDTNLTKENVAIGMDGRIGYLQAHDVVATGLTVDELRDRLNQDLGAFYRTPRVVVTPVAYRSKKYYVLGKVTAPGAYVLDQPVTIVEALARAKGLASGLVDRNSIDLADLSRSFLIRGGKRQSIDFERLFQEGDFSQNVALEPQDFLYFAPANLQEIYVLGQVRSPGPVSFSANKSVMGALAERGGFTDTAWKQRVLVVRGSLAHPQTFVVDTWTVLDARAKDFRLQPHDIVFVSNRPFFYGEELLDVAVTAFLQSSVTDWTAAYITLFDRPIIPHP